jgi:Fe-S-cluster containining protein
MKAFECKQCGSCCYGEGGVPVERGEIERIALFLALTPDAFIQMYCREKHGRVYVASAADGFCVFYDQGKQCRIHPVKPRPCSLWPFYPALLREKENWEMARDACPGINRNCSFEEFVRQSKE